MTATRSGFLLGIGSNIDPDDNIAKIVWSLLKHFPMLEVSRVLKIPPIGMDSHRDFLNMVIFVETMLAHQGLKTICNDIEVKLGRDRDDPESKMKDRPADLDILTAISFPDDKHRTAESITDEYFLYPLINELFAFLLNTSYQTQQTGVIINIEGLTFGQSATTINGNAGTSDKGIS